MAANIGVSIVVNPVGSDSMTASGPFDCSQLYGEREWQLTVTQDEDGLLHQLRALLIQARDASRSLFSFLLLSVHSFFLFFVLIYPFTLL